MRLQEELSLQKSRCSKMVQFFKLLKNFLLKCRSSNFNQGICIKRINFFPFIKDLYQYPEDRMALVISIFSGTQNEHFI